MNFKYEEPTFLHPKQQAIYDCESRNVVCISSNKCGKTLLCALLMNKNMLLMPSGSTGAWLAPYARTSKIGYDLVCKTIRSSPVYKYLEDIMSPKRFKFNSSQLQITYPNDNRIDFLQGQNTDAIFGQKYHFCIIDEATRLKQAVVETPKGNVVVCPAFNALKTTTRTTNARIVIISNPTTKSNFFYKWYLRAEKGLDSRTTAFHMDVYDAVRAGFVDIEEVDYAKETEPSYIFTRDWLGLVPEQENSVFKEDKVLECISKGVTEGLQNVAYFGIDLGFTVNGSSDYTVICGLNEECELVFFRRFKKEGQDLINKIKGYIKDKPAYIDATAGGGHTIYTILSDDCYNLEPIKFNNANKCDTIETLAHCIHTNELSYPNNDILLGELLGYECEMDNKGTKFYNNGKSVAHDDSVIALGLAIKKYKEMAGDLPYDFFL